MGIIQPGIRLWLDASQLVLADGAGVASWPDASATWAALSQGTPAQQPIFKAGQLAAKGIVHFNVGQQLTGASGIFGNLGRTSSWTLTTVLRFLPFAGAGRSSVLLSSYPGSPGSGPGFFTTNSSPSLTFVQIGDSGGGTLLGEWPPIPLGKWMVWTLNYDGSSRGAGLVSLLNGSVVSPIVTAGILSGSLSSSNPLVLGSFATGDSGFLGDLAELALWSPALSPTARVAVEGSLILKWLGTTDVTIAASPYSPFFATR